MRIPPLLLATVLLFWGWYTDLLLFAVIMAIPLEAARWIKLRWDLTLADFNRISNISSFLLIGMLIYLFLTQSVFSVVFLLLQWLPLIFFPLLLAQYYSTAGTIDARALFMTLRSRRKRAEQQEPITIRLAYPYVLICLLSASVANVRTRPFYLGVLLLAIWTLWSTRSKRYSLLTWGLLAMVVVVGGYFGQGQLFQLQRALERNQTVLRWFAGIQTQDVDPYESNTAIGDIGMVKLSNRTIFRVKSETGPQPPLLLREATYTTYQFSRWYAVRAEFTDLIPEPDRTTWKLPAAKAAIPPGPPLEKGGTEAIPPGPPLGKGGTEAIPPGSPLGKGGTELHRLSVSIRLTNGKGILKFPTGTVQLENLLVGILVSNQFGVVKVVEGPDVITYQPVFVSLGAVDSPPGKDDLIIPLQEAGAIQELVEELALTSISPAEVPDTIARFFRQQFSYSLKLPYQKGGMTPLADFLSNSRNGHCEYFATATVLLLRAAGIPARYAVGYSIDGLSGSEKWTMVRGRDAHAWALVYLNGAWHDCDTTPPSWRSIEEQAASPLEWVSGLWSQWMFTLSEWRQSERAGELIRSLIWLLIPIVLALVWRWYAARRPKRALPQEEELPAVVQHPGEDSTFYLIERRLQELGFERHPWESLLQWIRRLEQQETSVSPQTLYLILGLHYRYRFDPEGLTPEEKTVLATHVQGWLADHHDVKREA